MAWLLQQCQKTVNISKHSILLLTSSGPETVYGLISVMDHPLSGTGLKIRINTDDFSRLLQVSDPYFSLGYSWEEGF